MNYNKIVLVGRLGKDPRCGLTPQTQKAYASLWMATSIRGKDGDKTEWHSITCWEKQAEFCEKYLKKGNLIMVEGRMTYKDREKDGVKWRDAEIVANSVQSLEPKPKETNKDEPQGVTEWTDIPF